MGEKYRRLNERMMCVERRRRQIGESTLQALEIQPSQHFVLVWLKHMGKAASQSRLAEMMQVSPASVARTLKNLDRDGYIARSGGDDGRCNATEITEKGEKVLAESLKLFGELDERCYAGFSDAELEQMETLMDKLLSNLNQIKNEKEIKE